MNTDQPGKADGARPTSENVTAGAPTLVASTGPSTSAAEARAERYRMALLNYGEHRPSCEFHAFGPCSCGFGAELLAAQIADYEWGDLDKRKQLERDAARAALEE